MAKNKEEKETIGKVKPLSISEEMKDSYISYAMSVIVSRALPDVRDGLKPVQRRILFAMHKMGLTPGSGFRKSATVVGHTLGNYHPHGDQAAYDAMVRMAQDFSLRYPLVKPQGNFGSIDGDPPAAQRYTEAKLSSLGALMLEDIEKETVDFSENFDGTKTEPDVLPSPVPQMLLNGCIGIAVGMATKIPPHNLSEVCDAAIHLIDNPKSNTEDLLQFIKGPDFPTGGVIYDREQIVESYSQGRGPVLVRGRAEIVEGAQRARVVVSEIPFGVNKPKLLMQIARLVQEEKLKRVKDIRDESGQEGVRIVLDLKRGAAPGRVLNFLYKRTYLQSTFHLNMVALEGGIQPKRMSLSDILSSFVEHRREVVTRRIKYDKEKAEARAHILEGFEKAMADIDEVIKTIKASKDRADAQKNLVKKFKLTDIQAEAILNMRLSSLARMEREKIEQELKEKRALIKKLTAILGDPKKIDKVIKEELEDIKEEYGDKRKTKVFAKKADEITPDDLIPDEEVVVALTQKGMIKRMNASAYRVQRRGGKGVIGAKTKEEDQVEHLVFANTHDWLYFFTDSGKVFKSQVYEVPAGKRTAKGANVMNFIQISSDEKILALLPLDKEQEKNKDAFFIMATQKGRVKKTEINEYKNVRRDGLIAINLKKGDLLKEVRVCEKKKEIVLVSRKGKAIRFQQKDVRAMGRTAMGVKGMDLSSKDSLVAMGVVSSDKEELLTITENGYGKRTALSEYRVQKRSGKGIKTAHLTKKTGDIVEAKVLGEEEKYLISISAKGQIIKSKINEISKMGRSTQGVKVMELDKGDKIASVSIVDK